MKTCSSLLFAALILLVMPVVATAQVELRSMAEVETVTVDENGRPVTDRKPAVKVVPGDEVVYTVAYHNTGAEPADDVIITNPVPDHMNLLRTNGLPQGLVLFFSVDGGQTFDTLARLEVTDNNGRPRPATAADCTHLRWVFERELAPGEAGTVSYVAQLL